MRAFYRHKIPRFGGVFVLALNDFAVGLEG